LNFASQARNYQDRHEAVPLYPFISLVCLQLRDEAQVKSLSQVRSVCDSTIMPHAIF